MRNLVLAATLSLTAFSPLAFAQNPAEPKPATAAEAQAFVDGANAELLKLTTEASHAQWTAETDITGDTEATSALINEQATARALALTAESHRFDHVKLPPELKRQIKLLQVNAPAAPKDPKLLQVLPRHSRGPGACARRQMPGHRRSLRHHGQVARS
jgi:peptidyl-dipeptidase A